MKLTGRVQHSSTGPVSWGGWVALGVEKNWGTEKEGRAILGERHGNTTNDEVKGKKIRPRGEKDGQLIFKSMGTGSGL